MALSSVESEYNTLIQCIGCSCIIGSIMFLISLLIFLINGLPALIQNNSEFIQIYRAWLSLIFVVIGLLIIVIPWLICGSRVMEIEHIINGVSRNRSQPPAYNATTIV